MEIPRFWNRTLLAVVLGCSAAGPSVAQERRSAAGSPASAATALPSAALQAAPQAEASPAAQTTDAKPDAALRHGSLRRPESLAELAARAQRERRPVVVLFSREGCGWCEAIRREQLGHLAREAQARGVLVVEFDLADARAFRPPASNERGEGWASEDSPAALARRLGIRVAPTVAFLGRGGELAERLVGYGSPDFYGAYLDERIAQARSAIR
jgi:thioredoxin-related protein